MVIALIFAGLFLTAIFVWTWSKISVRESRLAISTAGAHFPIVSGSNLMRKEFEFPGDFEGKYNLVIIPFQQIQQQDVNTWIPAAQELERSYDN
ncbi:MAG: hypothetical protein E4H33_03665, partial [Anaerolineales bacterium]